jgi:hypothetical protein
LAREVDHARLADRVDLIPVRAEPMDRLRAITDETAPLQLEQRQRPHELGLKRRPELGPSAQHDLGDRDRIARVGLARTVPMTLAMRAPGGHVEHLVACRFQRGDEEPAVASRAFDTHDRLARVMRDQPSAQPAHPFRAVREAERADLAAALVQQRGYMGALVYIDPDDHGVLLSRG